jgi:hypothetical protein
MYPAEDDILLLILTSLGRSGYHQDKIDPRTEFNVF